MQVFEEWLYDEKLQQAITIAQSIAKEFKNEHFSSPHLLKALLHDEIELTPLLEVLEKDIFYMRDWADFGIENYPKSSKLISNPSGDEIITKIFNQADIVRAKLSRDKIDPLSTFLTILQPGIAFTPERLRTFPITYQELMNAVIEKNTVKEAISPQSIQPSQLNKSLFKYCIDKTELARANKLDPVIGRNSEIQTVFEILGRRLKNNVLIIGEPGVGKTAIIDGLAQLIISGDVPTNLKSKIILELDIKSLIAGATYKGEFEERLKNVLKEIKTLNNSILFIDEIHALIESGGGSGPSVGDLLKPELSRGEINLIGVTTLEEYRTKIQPEKAFDRRFEKVIIQEPNSEITLQMLKGVLGKYEEHHNLKISENALIDSIRFAKKYLKESWLPDSAIDLIDRTFSAVKLENEKLDVEQRKNTIESEDIVKVIARQTGIPLGRLQMEEKEKLLNMEEHLKSRVVGQDHAIQAIAEAVREARSGLSIVGKPIGGFFLLGPTGTGKTETAKALAEFLFDDEQALIRFDMSEFKEAHSAALLYGAPPGYVGYKEGGLLVNKIREKPYAIVLFDEIEKAHPSVYDLFLQILDEGKLHDKLGKVGDFSNSIVLFTSNVGSDWITSEIEKGNLPDSRQCQEVMGKYFRPEFLGRLTDIIPFKPLDEANMEKIFSIQMKSLYQSLQEQNVFLEICDAAKKYLIREGFHPQFGARPLIGVIRNQLRRPLSRMLIAGEVVSGKKVIIDFDKNENLQWEVI